MKSNIDLASISKRYWFGLVMIGMLGVVPLFTSQTQLVTVTGIIYLMMFAMTWDVASGYTGQLNFGHAAFIAVGGYTTAILNINYGVSPLVSIPVAVVISAIAGLVIGIPALRLRGAYLALVTLVAPSIFYQIVIVFDDIFKGSSGFNVPPANLVGVSGSTSDSIISAPSYPMAIIIDYYIAYSVLLMMLVILYAYTRSDAGKILTAIREDEDALIASGINPAKHKVFSFLISSAFAGFAGALYVHSAAGFPHPSELLAPTLSLNVIIISVFGGLGTIIGAFVGALIFGSIEFLAYQLSFNVLGQSVDDVVPIFLFILAMIVVYHSPRGLVPYTLEKGERWWGSMNEDEGMLKMIPDENKTAIEQIFEKYKENIKKIGPGKNE